MEQEAVAGGREEEGKGAAAEGGVVDRPSGGGLFASEVVARRAGLVVPASCCLGTATAGVGGCWQAVEGLEGGWPGAVGRPVSAEASHAAAFCSSGGKGEGRGLSQAGHARPSIAPAGPPADSARLQPSPCSAVPGSGEHRQAADAVT
jgi:hypothetical protein